MQYLLIVLHAGLVESVYIGQGPLIGDGEEEEIHERSYMIRRELLHGDMAAHALFRSQGFLISPSGSGKHTAHGNRAACPLFITEHSQVCRKMLHRDELYQFIFLPLLMLLGKGMHIRSSHSSHRRPAVIDDISLKVIFLAQRFAKS